MRTEHAPKHAMTPTRGPTADLAARPPAAPSEEELLAALGRGDQSAAHRLVEASYAKIYRALLRLAGGDAELAADLTQETYRRAWAALSSFRGRSAFATWLYRIAYTTYLNHVRRPRRLTPLTDEAAALVEDPHRGPDGDLEETREAARLRRAVLELPEDLRFTVTAHFWGEQSVPDVARQEGLSPVAIRKRLKRAYVLLEAKLGQGAEELT